MGPDIDTDALPSHEWQQAAEDEGETLAQRLAVSATRMNINIPSRSMTEVGRSQEAVAAGFSVFAAAVMMISGVWHAFAGIGDLFGAEELTSAYPTQTGMPRCNGPPARPMSARPSST